MSDHGLNLFDPISIYPAYDGMETTTRDNVIREKDEIVNLLVAMTAPDAYISAEIVRVVRHSMVVIQAEKHNLNYQQSRIDNGIPQLVDKYLRS